MQSCLKHLNVIGFGIIDFGGFLQNQLKVLKNLHNCSPFFFYLGIFHIKLNLEIYSLKLSAPTIFVIIRFFYKIEPILTKITKIQT